MDREEIEDLVHASLGRHLRVTCVLGLLFLAVGFVLGHFVAAQHARELSDRLTRRTERWTSEADDRAKQMDVTIKAELAEIRELATVSRELQKRHEVALAELSERRNGTNASSNSESDLVSLLTETQRLSRATDELRLALVVRSIHDAEETKDRVLRELPENLNQKVTGRAAEVSNAVNELVDAQLSQLESLALVRAPQSGHAADYSPTPADISPISGEAQAPHCPAPVENPLTPVAESPFSESGEAISLIPAPKPALTRSPANAEPTASPLTGTSKSSPQITAPRKQRVYIPARKPLELSTAVDPIIR